MYVAQHFRLDDAWLSDLLGRVLVGNLVTVHSDGPMSTLVPFFVEERDGTRFLVAHLVRNNPQAREPIVGKGLAILDVADAFVSPAWYATNEALPNVPTWDYITLHARGPVTVDPSPAGALRAARELSIRMGEQWSIDLVGEQKLRMMARAIVGVEMEVTELEAKAKMSQNRHPDDVRSLLAHFDESGPEILARYLREVSLPHAEQRFDTVTDLKSTGARRYRLRGSVG